MSKRAESGIHCLIVVGIVAALASHTVGAQSVFDSGINSFVAWALAIATPVAVLFVM